MIKKIFIITAILLSQNLFAQELPERPRMGRGPFIKNQITLGTNALGYAAFLTLNAEMSISVHKNWTVHIQGKLNPFTFNKNQPSQLQSRQATLAVGGRWWPWHVNSGWFVGSSLQYTRYNQGGIIDPETFEGNAAGLNANFGYALMLSKRWNIEFGAGVLAGWTNYTKFACPRCGKITGEDKKIFVAPNNLLIQIQHIF